MSEMRWERITGKYLDKNRATLDVFLKLIAREAAKEERERCAKVAEKWRGTTAGLEIAAAIREDV